MVVGCGISTLIVEAGTSLLVLRDVVPAQPQPRFRSTKRDLFPFGGARQDCSQKTFQSEIYGSQDRSATRFEIAIEIDIGGCR